MTGGDESGDRGQRIKDAARLLRQGRLQQAEVAYKALRDEADALSDEEAVEVYLGLARVMNQTGRRRRALEAVAEVDRRGPGNADAAALRMQINHALGFYDVAMAAADDYIAARPDEQFGYYMKALSCFYRDRRDKDNQVAAAALYEQARDREPRNYHVLGALAAVMTELGETEYVRTLGQDVLYYKDKETCTRFAKSEFKDVQLNRIDKPFDPYRRERNVIAFSLFGDNPIYLQGAIANAEIAPHLYPEWTCRFYCDPGIPKDVTDRLRAARAEVVTMEGNKQWSGTFWRFLASDDPNVDRFLARDVDSRLNVQERVAVEEWIASGKPFHIMRDNLAHREFILAGMWGGVAGVIPGMEDLYKRKHLLMPRAHADQTFLKDVIWPLIRNEALIHDSCFKFLDSRDYPKYGRLPWNLHIGCGFKTLKAWFWYWP